MSIGRPTTRQFLSELIRCTQGDLQAKISMYEVGAALGLGKTDAGKLAEEVIAEGWAEIKTLSGDIGLTPDGIAASGANAAGSEAPLGLSMGNGPVVQNDGLPAVEQILEQIQERLNGLSIPYDTLEEMVMDLKTARVQLLSPKPKTAIIKEVLRSLGDAMQNAGADDTAAQIQAMINTSSSAP
jgi:hypothetical protein